MTRSYTEVMYDLARVQEEARTSLTFLAEDEWPAFIIELAELPEDLYQAALATHLTLTKICNVAERYVA